MTAHMMLMLMMVSCYVTRSLCADTKHTDAQVAGSEAGAAEVVKTNAKDLEASGGDDDTAHIPSKGKRKKRAAAGAARTKAANPKKYETESGASGKHIPDQIANVKTLDLRLIDDFVNITDSSSESDDDMDEESAAKDEKNGKKPQEKVDGKVSDMAACKRKADDNGKAKNR